MTWRQPRTSERRGADDDRRVGVAGSEGEEGRVVLEHHRVGRAPVGQLRLPLVGRRRDRVRRRLRSDHCHVVRLTTCAQDSTTT